MTDGVELLLRGVARANRAASGRLDVGTRLLVSWVGMSAESALATHRKRLSPVRSLCPVSHCHGEGRYL